MKKENHWQKIEQLKSNHLLAANLWIWKDHIYVHHNAIAEADYLLSIQIHILFQLRSGYLNTNYVKHILNHLPYYSKHKFEPESLIKCTTCCIHINNGLCQCNKENETVEHFILYCTNYTNNRIIMLQKILPYYNAANIHFNLRNLLFIPNEIATNPKYRWFHRKMIYTALCKFVISANRWNFH